MQKAKIKEIKILVKETFWEFNHYENEEITPSLVREFVRHNLPEDVLYETAVLVPSKANCWGRIESLCLYLKSVNYRATL
jgi:predicted methyltransferase